MKTVKSIHTSWLAALGLCALLVAPAAMAQPDRHGHHPRADHPRHDRPQYAPPRYAPAPQRYEPRHESRHAPRHEPRHYAPPRHAPRVVHRAPPRDFYAVRRDLHPHMRHIKRGPALPPHYRVARGHALPHGYGRVLAYEHHHYLPYYAGYEWRTSGRDLLLVAATTGIVYAIMDNMLQ